MRKTVVARFAPHHGNPAGLRLPILDSMEIWPKTAGNMSRGTTAIHFVGARIFGGQGIWPRRSWKPVSSPPMVCR